MSVIGVATGLQAAWHGWWKVLAGALLVCGPAFLAGRCSVDPDTAAAVVAGNRDRQADDTAARQRRADDTTIAAASTQVENVTRDLAPAPTSPRQRARACELFRQQGAGEAALGAAGCRPDR